jgi:hypothetical protein
MVAATLDPDGRRVVLNEEAWAHIKEEHRDLTRKQRDIMAAVREPDRRMPGRVPDEEWFFAEEIRPGRWLHVVVHFEGGEGWIATAFTRTLLPRR